MKSKAEPFYRHIIYIDEKTEMQLREVLAKGYTIKQVFLLGIKAALRGEK